MRGGQRRYLGVGRARQNLRTPEAGRRFKECCTEFEAVGVPDPAASFPPRLI
jgi:hypothetical protein